MSLGGGDSPSSLEPAWQRKNRKQLSNSLQPYAMDFATRFSGAYSDPLVAGMTGMQKEALQGYSDFFKTPTPGNTAEFGNIQNELTKMLTGSYDPSESAYYGAFKTALMRELAQGQDELSRQSSARDSYFGGGRLDQSRQMQEGAYNQQAQVMAALMEQERNRMMQAIPLQMQALQYGQESALQRLGAQYQAGEMERALQQAQLDAQYQDYLRRQGIYQNALGTQSGLLTYQPPYYVNQAGSGIGDLLGGLGGMMGGMMGGMSGTGMSGIGALFAGI